MFLLHPFVKLNIGGGDLRDQEVAMLNLKTARVRILCLENSVFWFISWTRRGTCLALRFAGPVDNVDYSWIISWPSLACMCTKVARPKTLTISFLS